MRLYKRYRQFISSALLDDILFTRTMFQIIIFIAFLPFYAGAINIYIFICVETIFVIHYVELEIRLILLFFRLWKDKLHNSMIKKIMLTIYQIVSLLIFSVILYIYTTMNYNVITQIFEGKYIY
jgi:hypothetical protein